MPRFSKLHWTLLVGDFVVLAVVTLVGFASHGSLATAGSRMLTTFFPMLAAWLVTAPWFGLFDLVIVRSPRQLWRVLWAMLLAAPLGTLLRGLWLASIIQPTFVLVMLGVSGLGLLIWRAIFLLLAKDRG